MTIVVTALQKPEIALLWYHRPLESFLFRQLYNIALGRNFAFNFEATIRIKIEQKLEI